ncbi:glycosyltransferase family 39 protein [soil metagenome]
MRDTPGDDHRADPGEPARPSRGRLERFGRGPADDPTWARPALFVLLGATAVLYLWGLGASGWANSFYSAAVQAGTHSWKAFFFGSSDSSNAITVDKPPVALWAMGISARIFGVNAWSILVPQALAGVASVGVLHAAVKRWFGASAGLIAGAVLAVTPIATLMFRFNNPDAFLVLLLIGAAYALTRALEATSTRWLMFAWSLVGLGFLTKMLQALLVAPAFALVYLICADTPLRRRFLQSAAAFAALVASAGWYVAIVELWPASSRPYIGGSQSNSIMELVMGYNGLGRLTGVEAGSANNGGNWGSTGWNRLFNSEFGSQAAWLIPAALVLLGAGLWLRRRAPRTDRARAGLILWGGWFLVTAAAFSFGKGIIHPYYTVALAPAVGALVGIGVVPWWQRRERTSARIVLAGTLALTTTFSYFLLHRTPDWAPLLQDLVLIGGLLAAALIAFAPTLRGKVGAGIAAAALVLALAGPTAYSLQTASVAHSGSLPTAGPGSSGMGGPGGGGAGPGFGGGTPPTGAAPTGTTGTVTAPTGAATTGTGNAGSLLDGSTSTDDITALLQADAGSYRWVAAAIGSNSASGYQLAADEPVMAVGGFNGSDPSPTLAEFQAYVAAGDIHYFIAGGGGMGGGMGGGPGGGTSTSTTSEISTWVTANYTATTVDGVTLYDLTT